ncbi:SsrA-binding protein [Candidatus Peregrinibacteria bacterium CG_4_9_14_0_2_um_filter_53_11]|nr:MAG: SsrA-binding protein [Candidatus Peregrinibacteria bacterium CG_4_9_14_0_2_um_filter_53_11]
MSAPEKADGLKAAAKNKKAYFDYEILEKFEAGIILTGPEVKSIRKGLVQLKGSYVQVFNGRAYIEKMHISYYPQSNNPDYDPLRSRELLLHKKELELLAARSAEKGLTLVPLEILLKKHLIKVILGVCRGKKQHDKRSVLKDRAVERDIQSSLKKFSR